MPLYDFRCEKCGKKSEIFMRMAEYTRARCCEQEMQRVYSYAVVPDLKPYVDQNLSEKPVYVRSKKHRQELMRNAGVSERYGKGWV